MAKILDQINANISLIPEYLDSKVYYAQALECW